MTFQAAGTGAVFLLHHPQVVLGVLRGLRLREGAGEGQGSPACRRTQGCRADTTEPLRNKPSKADTGAREMPNAQMTEGNQ